MDSSWNNKVTVVRLECYRLSLCHIQSLNVLTGYRRATDSMQIFWAYLPLAERKGKFLKLQRGNWMTDALLGNALMIRDIKQL